MIKEIEEVEEVEEIEDEDHESPKQKRKISKKISASKEKTDGIERELEAMKLMVEKEKQAILASKDLEESEKNRLLQQAEERVVELESERAARHELANKLAQMEQKLLVGGVNIIDQHEKQQLMLANKAQELEERARKERDLQNHLLKHEETNLQIEEEFSNLQEEASAKSKKIKKLWNLYQSQKGELKDLIEEHQREREDLLETIRELSSDLKMQNSIIQCFIPLAEQDLIDHHAEYDEIAEKWRIANIAHAGNNIRGKRSLVSGKLQILGGSGLHRDELVEEPDFDPACIFPDVYLSYDIPGPKKKDHKKILKQVIGNAKRNNKSARSDELRDKAVETSITPKARGLVGKKKRYA